MSYSSARDEFVNAIRDKAEQFWNVTGIRIESCDIDLDWGVDIQLNTDDVVRRLDYLNGLIEKLQK